VTHLDPKKASFQDERIPSWASLQVLVTNTTSTCSRLTADNVGRGVLAIAATRLTKHVSTWLFNAIRASRWSRVFLMNLHGIIVFNDEAKRRAKIAGNSNFHCFHKIS
jgi:hypothetical protein